MDLLVSSQMKKSLTFLLKFIIIAGIISALIWIAYGAEVSPRNFVLGIPTMARYVWGMFPPSTEVLGKIGNPLLETFQIAIVAIIASTVIGIPLSFLAARNLTPNLIVYQTMRTLLGTMRGIPPMLYAVFLVAMVGLGPFAGTMALTLSTIGKLGRYCSEAIENIDADITNSAKAAGANKAKTIWYVVIPELKALFLGYILYYFESNIRDATTLGLVGAGGIGLLLIIEIHLFKYHEVGTIMLIIIALIIIMDRLSFIARQKLIKG